jgi:dTDP-4-amino-4,6-dideoxygalactose transaminase
LNLNFDILNQFEKILSEYTGAPYVVLTDSCTHAIELCLRILKPASCTIPAKTYLSIPMTFHKLGIDLSYDSYCDWQYEYRLTPTNIWDSARAFDKDMYRVGALQCLSFGHTKRLEIGHGGAILTNNLYYYKKLKMMAYDGRDLSVSPWQDQKKFELGFHYNMRLEDARKGIIMMNRRILKDKNTQVVNYPDCSKLEINT